MSLFALLLVSISAVGYASYNTLTKRLFQTGEWKGKAGAMTAYHLLVAFVVLMILSAFTGGPQITQGFWFAACITGSLNIVIAYSKIRARELEDASLVVPIDSTTPAVVIVTAMLITGETTSVLGWIGIWLVALGTYVLNIQAMYAKLEERVDSALSRRQRLVQIWFAPFIALGRSRGVRFAFLAVLLSTISLPYDGLTARHANPAFGLGIISLIAGGGNLILAKRSGELTGVTPRMLRGAAMLGALFGIAGVLTAYAFLYSTVPYVGTMKRLQIPLTIVLAAIFLGERANFRSRIAGGLVMVSGAILIALA